MRHGQLTLIVLVGIMVLFAFGFLLAIRQSISRTTLSSEADQAIQGYLQSTSVSAYITSCIDRITEESVYYLGRQGGVLYNSTAPYDQNGWTNNLGIIGSDYIEYESERITQDGLSSQFTWPVRYGIRAQENQDCADITIPDYPFAGTALDRAFSKYIGNMNRAGSLCPARENVLGGPYGRFSLPKLCDTNGPNRIDASDNSFHSCFIGTYAETGSIQDELSDYIERELLKCANDFAPFVDINGNLIEAQKDPSVNITFAPDDFTIIATYPIKVSLAGKEPVTQLVDFPFTKKTRLKKVYELAALIIKSENTNVKFGMQEARAFAGNDISIIRIRNPCTACNNGAEHDDMIEIKDFKSQIRGEPFVFRFAVEDRNPALDLIQFPQGNILPQYYHMVVLENKPIRIDPKGYDPEEENPGNAEYRMREKYSYSGWKADYEHINHFAEPWIWNGVENTNGGLISALPRDIRDEEDANEFPYEDPITCVRGNPNCEQGNEWEQSAPFTDTNPETHGRVAEYVTNDDDKGPHEVRVTVQKQSGLIDYQIIHILVADLCAAGRQLIDVFAGKNPSIEDPYVLESCSMTPFSEWRYVWTDPLEGGLLGENMVLSFDKQMNNPLLFPFRNPGHHTVTLEVITPTESSTTTLELDVKQCTPYSMSGDPYPYSQGIDGNPFLTDHACCSANGELMPGIECFRFEGPSCYRPEGSPALAPADVAVQDAGGKTLEPAIVTTTINAPSTLSTFQLENDIFRRTYTQDCGNRGNACSGTVEDALIHLTTCDDLERSGQDERCEGPARTRDQCDSVTNTCYPYAPGETFELTYEGSGTGYCNQDIACSSRPGIGGYGTGGKLSCTGQCDGQGGCSFATDCTCDVGGLCGAVCDTGYYDWGSSGNTHYCNTQCDTNRCDYSQRTRMPCAPGVQSCLYTGPEVLDSIPQPIRKDHCYHQVDCNAGGSTFTGAEYCPAGGTSNGESCTYFPSNSRYCDDTGQCVGRETDFKWQMSYDDGNFNCYYACDWNTLQCDATQGWVPGNTAACLVQDVGVFFNQLAFCQSIGYWSIICTQNGWTCS